MKKIMMTVLLLVMLSTSALADGMNENSTWVNSQLNGSQPLSVFAGNYDGYVNIDGWDSETVADSLSITVISKAASVWAEPRTGSKKLGSLEHGSSLPCISYDGGATVSHEGSFYEVEYKGRHGWVNEDYVVQGSMEIVLMESNVPAYIAPDTHAKKVGSLSKLSRYSVIGIYDDFYIINLRGAAAAFIPMSAKHYDRSFEKLYDQSPTWPGQVNQNTELRTGPGERYPEIKELKAGTTFDCLDWIDGYYLIRYESKNASGFAYIDSTAATVNGL